MLSVALTWAGTGIALLVLLLMALSSVIPDLGERDQHTRDGQDNGEQTNLQGV